MKQSSKTLLGAVLGAFLAFVAVSALSYFSGQQQTGLYTALQPTAATPSATTTVPSALTGFNTTVEGGQKSQAQRDSASIQAVAQTGFSGNLLLIVSFAIPLVLAVVVYLILKKKYQSPQLPPQIGLIGLLPAVARGHV